MWKPTRDNRIEVLHEDGEPTRVSVRLEDGESMDDTAIAEIVVASCDLGFGRSIVFDGAWGPGEAEGEMVRFVRVVAADDAEG